MKTLLASLLVGLWATQASAQLVEQCTWNGNTRTCVYGRLAPSAAYRACEQKWSFTPLCALGAGLANNAWAGMACHDRWIHRHCDGL
jgi:hypothetical protein